MASEMMWAIRRQLSAVVLYCCHKRTDLNTRRSLGGRLSRCFQELVEKRRSLFCNRLGMARVIVGHKLRRPKNDQLPESNA